MSTTGLIIAREYLTRVRKKTFIIMTILGPLLFGAMFILPPILMNMEDQEERLIAVVDSSGLFINKIPDTQNLKFEYLENVNVNELKETLKYTSYYGILYVGHIVTYSPTAIQFISTQQPPLNITMHIANAMEKEIESKKLKAYEIDNLDDILTAIKTRVSIQTIKLSGTGEEKESHTGLAMAVSYVSGFLMYMFILLFGSQVMRGVIEEKSSRIIEVIISSVRPFQLMMGKITGIALVGLTQFLLWIVLTAVVVTLAKSFITPWADIAATPPVASGIMSTSTLDYSQEIPSDESSMIKEAFSALGSINFTLMLSCLLFYFLGGYLLYGSFFAAIGSAVDNETDTQQFMFPITIPLIVGLMVMLTVFQNPDSQVAFWFSMIPFTSPIVMMARLPFGVPPWELVTSMIVLVITFVGTTWLAAKIYRTGILMYGKKVSYKELWKWLRYSA